MNESAIKGKDSFLFGFAANLSNLDKCLTRFDTYACNKNDEQELKFNSGYGCYNKEAINGGAYCTRLIQANGWKLPQDYPYKF